MKRNSMNAKSRPVLATLVTGLWINASEFFRNEILLKSYWVDHYRALDLTFPSEPVNGLVWMLWGFAFALGIYIVSRKFSWMQTTLLSWLLGFVLMWLVIGNMAVLPAGVLRYAVPLSLLECGLAAFMCQKLSAV